MALAARGERRGQLAEGPAEDGAGDALVKADTQELLTAYRAVLDLVGGHRFFVPGARRRLSRVKPTFGVQSYVVEHVRANVDRFSKGYCLRLAMNEDDGDDQRDREALANFSSSLPDRRPRLWILLPYLIALVITQVAVSAIGHQKTVDVLHDLIGLANLSPDNISTSADHLIRQDDHRKVLGVMIIGSAALWLAFRPLMWGFQVKRVLLNESHAAGRRERKTELAGIARQLDVRGHEEKLCLCMRMRPPLDSPLDLWIKATIMIPWIIVGAVAFGLAFGGHGSQGGDLAAAAIVLVCALLRLAWLAHCARERARFREAATPPG